MEKQERIKLFDQALSLIKDNNIKLFCEELLGNADDYFFHEAASSTGKYHPTYALGEGGLARHSIAAALFLNNMFETNCYDFSDKQKDMLICAAIVHDIKKYGRVAGRYTVKDHPEIAAEYVMESYNGFIDESDAKYIADAIKTHMGQWGTEKPSTDAQKVLHIADYLASRKHIEIKFDHPEVVGINESKDTKAELEDPGEYVFTFGKYNGKKVKEIDPSYLRFIIRSFDNREHPAVVNSEKYLNSLK